MRVTSTMARLVTALPAAAAAALCLSLAAAGAASAAEGGIVPIPGAGAPAAVPEAADKTLGMAIMSAGVAANGALVTGAGVVKVEPVGTGFYKLEFDRGLQGCTCVVTPGDPGGSFLTANLTSSATCGSVNFPNEAYAVFYNLQGNAANSAFTMIVFCPR